jgi:hypothetical protein
MSVYPVAAGKASCRLSGCACRDRAARYPSDLTDQQWALLEPEARAVMAELRKGPGGAPMSHDLRAMLDAIGYVTRYGVEWRALPVDFPPWTAVYAFFERWSDHDPTTHPRTRRRPTTTTLGPAQTQPASRMKQSTNRL